MPRTLPAVKRRSGKSAADRKLSIDKDILKFFPEPHRMGLPAPSHWAPALWHEAQLSPRMVVLARAWEAVAMSSWQPWHAAEIGAVVLVRSEERRVGKEGR